jgi:catechol 2,3-dioxygenase-like lactoylglutathione lyase family enzyme
MTATLEHANLTVPNPDATAAWICTVFGWHIRWSGPAISGGYTVHVGTDSGYLALYAPKEPLTDRPDSYTQTGGLNHVGLVVADLKAAEAKVKAAGFTPHSHADYEPGQRFYFHDDNNIEFEVVQYD